MKEAFLSFFLVITIFLNNVALAQNQNQNPVTEVTVCTPPGGNYRTRAQIQDTSTIPVRNTNCLEILCTNNGTPICDQTARPLQCVQCLRNDDCIGNPQRSKCNTRQNINLPENNLVPPNPASNRAPAFPKYNCVQCKNDGDCAGGKKYCDTRILARIPGNDTLATKNDYTRFLCQECVYKNPPGDPNRGVEKQCVDVDANEAPIIRNGAAVISTERKCTSWNICVYDYELTRANPYSAHKDSCADKTVGSPCGFTYTEELTPLQYGYPLGITSYKGVCRQNNANNIINVALPRPIFPQLTNQQRQALQQLQLTAQQQNQWNQILTAGRQRILFAQFLATQQQFIQLQQQLPLLINPLQPLLPSLEALQLTPLQLQSLLTLQQFRQFQSSLITRSVLNLSVITNQQGIFLGLTPQQLGLTPLQIAQLINPGWTSLAPLQLNAFRNIMLPQLPAQFNLSIAQFNLLTYIMQQKLQILLQLLQLSAIQRGQLQQFAWFQQLQLTQTQLSKTQRQLPVPANTKYCEPIPNKSGYIWTHSPTNDLQNN